MFHPPDSPRRGRRHVTSTAALIDKSVTVSELGYVSPEKVTNHNPNDPNSPITRITLTLKVTTGTGRGLHILTSIGANEEIWYLTHHFIFLFFNSFF